MTCSPSYRSASQRTPLLTAGPRTAALRCPNPRLAESATAEEAAEFVALLIGCLREVVNQTRPRGQLLALCAKPAQAAMAALTRSLGTRQFIAEVSAHSFALEGQRAVHDFVCRLEYRRDAGRVLAGRVQLGPAGWRLTALQQLPVVSRGAVAARK